MTIAAGFVCDAGVLLCADSQFTVVPTKVDGMKIGIADPEYGKIMVAFADNVDFAAGACQTVLRQSWRSGSTTAINKLAELLKEYYRRHVFGHPLYEDSLNEFSCNFLFGVKLNGDTAAPLFTTYDTVMRETGTFDCTGCGAVVARPMAGFLYNPQMSEAYAIAVASHVLHYVKRTIDGCAETTVIKAVEASKLILGHTEGNDKDFRNNLAQLNDLAFKYRGLWVNRTPSTQGGQSDPEAAIPGQSSQQPSRE